MWGPRRRRRCWPRWASRSTRREAPSNRAENDGRRPSMFMAPGAERVPTGQFVPAFSSSAPFARCDRLAACETWLDVESACVCWRFGSRQLSRLPGARAVVQPRTPALCRLEVGAGRQPRPRAHGFSLAAIPPTHSRSAMWTSRNVGSCSGVGYRMTRTGWFRWLPCGTTGMRRVDAWTTWPTVRAGSSCASANPIWRDLGATAHSPGP
jgi:hypothetical protein